ncbi:MAG: hypothetical protein IPF57_16025 [Gammaproteobacteria bacterium]|nr:hypothetical protein [Gammaproteobacteria bacterium]
MLAGDLLEVRRGRARDGLVQQGVHQGTVLLDGDLEANQFVVGKTSLPGLRRQFADHEQVRDQHPHLALVGEHRCPPAFGDGVFQHVHEIGSCDGDVTAAQQHLVLGSSGERGDAGAEQRDEAGDDRMEAMAHMRCNSVLWVHDKTAKPPACWKAGVSR